ncbi:G1 family glutamic endopeptidase [Ferrimicrobium sp.]|uniref:G1 family glutamic endopeptidase n=1 Tax=Ferrimicrobium sp. TaxID=2926050 RepID=UPI00344DFAC8
MSATGNWAELVDNASSASDAITSVSGTFVVPTLSSTQNSICTDIEPYHYCALAEWVEVDGESSQQLIQAGEFCFPELPGATMGRDGHSVT